MESIATLRDIPSQRLNKLVQIRRRQDLPMGDSELHSQFVEQCPRWCRIQPVGTAVYADGQQTGHAITHRIFMRRVMGITSAHEVVCDRMFTGSCAAPTRMAATGSRSWKWSNCNDTGCKQWNPGRAPARRGV